MPNRYPENSANVLCKPRRKLARIRRVDLFRSIRAIEIRSRRTEYIYFLSFRNSHCERLGGEEGNLHAACGRARSYSKEDTPDD